jgi:hypothetical protein
MSFNVDDVVAVIGFAGLLAWLPAPFPYLPLAAALIFPLYPTDAAWAGFCVALALGALHELLSIGR